MNVRYLCWVPPTSWKMILMLLMNALPTDQPTNQLTDTAYYRDARTHLKSAWLEGVSVWKEGVLKCDGWGWGNGNEGNWTGNDAEGGVSKSWIRDRAWRREESGCEGEMLRRGLNVVMLMTRLGSCKRFFAFYAIFLIVDINCSSFLHTVRKHVCFSICASKLLLSRCHL